MVENGRNYYGKLPCAEVEQLLEKNGVARTRDQLLVIARSEVPFGRKDSKLLLSWTAADQSRYYGELGGTNKLFVPNWGERGEGVLIIDEHTAINLYLCYHYQNGR